LRKLPSLTSFSTLLYNIALSQDLIGITATQFLVSKGFGEVKPPNPYQLNTKAIKSIAHNTAKVAVDTGALPDDNRNMFAYYL
jgi:hypothetical protein